MLNAQERNLVDRTREEERLCIREELLEAMGGWLKTVAWRGEGANERQIGAHAAINALQAALDRICPEGKE